MRDWTYSGVLRYQSGVLLPSPPSNNNLLYDLARGSQNNPAIWGGGYTFWNRVQGQPLFLVNPNSHFDPTEQLVLNPAAWSDAPLGQFGTSAPYFNNFRCQRQPAESMGFGRIFPMGKEGRYKLQIRAEFYNVFNRLFYSVPTDGAGFGTGATNPATPTTTTGTYTTSKGTIGNLLSAGYGFVAWSGGVTASPPRSGQIIARFTF